MTETSSAVVPDHIDFLVMQPDQEHAVMRDLTFAVLAFNKHDNGAPLQISFPLYTDAKVASRGVLGPCMRVTGAAEKLYTLTLRYEVSSHLRAGRAMTLRRERRVVEAGRNERFALVSSGGRGTPSLLTGARPLVLSGHSRLLETAGDLGVDVRDEAAFVARDERRTSSDGAIDLLGFSEKKTLPVLK